MRSKKTKWDDELADTAFKFQQLAKRDAYEFGEKFIDHITQIEIRYFWVGALFGTVVMGLICLMISLLG